MSAVAKKLFTPAEYLERERLAEFKSEYVNGEIIPLHAAPESPLGMAGASPTHNLIAGNVYGGLWGRLRGRPCRLYGSDQRVLVPSTSLKTYPDVSALCGPTRFDAQDDYALINPQVLVEVLSPSTANFDRGGKFAHYRRLESLKDYLLVSQDQMLVEHYSRLADGGWSLHEFTTPEAVVPLSALGCELPLAEIYDGVTFPPDGGDTFPSLLTGSRGDGNDQSAAG